LFFGIASRHSSVPGDFHPESPLFFALSGVFFNFSVLQDFHPDSERSDGLLRRVILTKSNTHTVYH